MIVGRTVGEVARLAGVTVRTLHHYDEIGLVRPSNRTDAGYRLYEAADLERLQQVLFYRELGFGLDEIGNLMAGPNFDRGAALREQRKLLEAEAVRLGAMIRAVDAAIDAHERGITMNEQDLFEVFGDFDPREYADEARQRWGDTDAYRQSTERTSRYSKQDWREVLAEGEAVARRFAAVMLAGDAATSDAAVEAAEAHRRHIDGRFYECSPAMHSDLGQLYVSDPRFTAYWDRYAPGLAEFVRDAIAANAERAVR
jgi:DNA-binding transcriptional MerR regulator